MSKLLAPNGKPSNLTAEQYELVRTPAFKKWFGDWENFPETASKVIDENGEPLVVYRGFNKKSDKGNVFKFGVNRFKHNRLANRFGHYFTNSKEVAKEYAEQGEKLTDDDLIIKPYFLNIKKLLNITKSNPKFPSFEQWIKVKPSGFLYSKSDIVDKLKLREIPVHSYLFYDIKVSNDEDIDELSEELIRVLENKIKEEENAEKERYKTSETISLPHLIKLISDEEINDIISEYNIGEAETNRDIYLWFINYKKNEKIVSDDLDVFLKDLIIKNGFNGGMYREWQFEAERGKTDLVYFTFESNQIKLADGTNTNFDSGNSDIRYAGGGEIKKVNIDNVKQFFIKDTNYRLVEILEKKSNKIEVYQEYDGKYYGILLYRQVPRYIPKFSSPMVNDINQLYAYVNVEIEELFDAVKHKKKPFGSFGFWLSYHTEEWINEEIKNYITECSKYNLEYKVTKDVKLELIRFEFCQEGTFDELFNIDDLIEDYNNNGFEDYDLKNIKNFRHYPLSYFLHNEWDEQKALTGLILGIPPKFTMSILNMWTTYDLSKEYKYDFKPIIIEKLKDKFNTGGELDNSNPDIRFKDGGNVNKNLKEVEVGNIIYHRSNPIFRKKIKEKGLITKGKSETWLSDTEINGKVIFATNSTDENDLFDSGYDDDVYEIDTTKLNNKWYLDPNFDWSDEYNHIITFEPIPKSAIKIIYMGSGLSKDSDEFNELLEKKSNTKYNDGGEVKTGLFSQIWEWFGIKF